MIGAFGYVPKRTIDEQLLQVRPAKRKQTAFDLVGANGQVIKTGNATHAMLQQVRAGKLSVRQPPGPENALGLV
jgi:hypothetical protein